MQTSKDQITEEIMAEWRTANPSADSGTYNATYSKVIERVTQELEKQTPMTVRPTPLRFAANAAGEGLWIYENGFWRRPHELLWAACWQIVIERLANWKIEDAFNRMAKAKMHGVGHNRNKAWRLGELPEIAADVTITDPPYGATACEWDTPKMNNPNETQTADSGRLPDAPCSPALARLIGGTEARRDEALSELNKGGHNDMVIGFWDGYRQACDDLLKWARDCQANATAQLPPPHNPEPTPK